MERKDILIDLDHTLTDAFWRDGMIGTVSWDEYHAASRDDTVVRDVAALIGSWRRGSFAYRAIGLTARPEKFRQLTLNWLLKNNVSLDFLLMRPDEAFYPAPEIKMGLAMEFYKTEDAIRENVVCIFDDREDVITAFRGIGVTALQVFARRGK